ncbi:MAG TPA: disulfide bond formation protein B, partial [Gammaproteobacteria bacterium]|nr:disulfide bond formation protein B [Gammaproteobacteria bacterium]
QSLPPNEAPACGPGFSYLMEVLPLKEALKQAFMGAGDCAQVQGTFLSLSLPSWTFILFTLLAILFLISSILEIKKG